MIEVRAEGNVLHLGGRFDAAQVEHVEAELGRLSGVVTLDLAQLEYLASAGIAVLVRAYKRLHAEGGTLRVQNVNGRILDVFRFSGINALFGC